MVSSLSRSNNLNQGKSRVKAVVNNKRSERIYMRGKQGVSLMMGYVLLIAIAIALSSLVFFYLKLWLPRDQPECSTDVDIVIDQVVCRHNFVSSGSPTSSVLMVNFSNRGLFNVDAAYIKIGQADRTVRQTLNDPERDRMTSICNNYETVLRPGEKFCGVYELAPAAAGIQEVSIEPLAFIDNKPVICTDSVIKRQISCS